MTNPYSIRPSFIVAHFQRQEEGYRQRMAINAAAESEAKELNRRFALADDPASPYATTHNNVGGEYKALRQAITDRARTLYDANLREVDVADRMDGITIYEFLLVDNLSQRAKEVIIQAARKSSIADFIGLRASADLADVAETETVGSIQRNLVRLVSHFDYAGRRCRIFFAIKPWHWSANKAIRRFKAEYKSELNGAFSRMKATPTVRGRY